MSRWEYPFAVAHLAMAGLLLAVALLLRGR